MNNNRFLAAVYRRPGVANLVSGSLSVLIALVFPNVISLCALFSAGASAVIASWGWAPGLKRLLGKKLVRFNRQIFPVLAATQLAFFFLTWYGWIHSALAVVIYCVWLERSGINAKGLKAFRSQKF